MEPMTLGSSPSSPTTNPNFLPSFLMGDNQPVPSPSNTAISPGRNKGQMLMKSPLGPEYQNALRQKRLFNQSSMSECGNSPFGSPAIEKSGPPKQGLFDTVDNPGPVLSSTMKHMNDHPFQSMNESSMFDSIDAYIPNTSHSIQRVQHVPATNESLYNYNDTLRTMPTMARPINQINTLWVTVFGFVPNSTSLILAQLATCGTILEKIFPPQGNWVHLKFCSPQEVAKALFLNGKLISNSIMIGVIPHFNKTDVDKENMNMAGSAAHYTSPIRARSLRTSGIPTVNTNTVVSPQNVPHKSTGLVTKAMEYVFGW